MHEATVTKMRGFVADYLAEFAAAPLRVIELGAKGAPVLRALFAPPWTYTGVDVSGGANVDIVLRDPYRWGEVADASADVLISAQTLERLEFPWRAMEEIARVLKPGGVACLVASSAGPERGDRADCWRLFAGGMRALARHAGLAPAEIFCDKGLGTWQDSFAVLQKPVGDAKAAARSPFPIFDDRRVAARAYAQAASSQPPSPLHALTLAALRRAEGDRAGAAAVLKAGAQAHPGHAALRQRLAEVSLEFGSPGVAIDQAAALFASKPFERPQVKALAELFGQLDDEARKQLRTRLPSEVAQLRRVGVLADGSASFALSRFVWEALAALEPLNKGVREYVALALLGCGARAEAMEVFAELRRAKLADGSLDRTVMVQKAIDAIRAGVYLEIGVSRGVNIFQIAAPTRLGVDPKFGIPGGIEGHPGCDFFRLPSDAFFAQPPRVIEPQGIDVAFVDGLHVYAQALRDVENCLRFLKPGGAIFMHDCLPANEAEAQARVEDARRMPGFTGSWTGDVYRAIVHMRALHPELRVAVVDVDHGVGIVERGKPESTLKMTAAEVARLSYADLKADPQRLLNLKPRKWFDSWLKRFASGRAA